MSSDQELLELRGRLSSLLLILRSAESRAEGAERKRLSGAASLPMITISRIDNYLSGDTRIPRKNLFQETISNLTRGLPEMETSVTEPRGGVADLIKSTVDFAIACRQRAS